MYNNFTMTKSKIHMSFDTDELVYLKRTASPMDAQLLGISAEWSKPT
jgi:hypothetical protein